MTYEYKKAYKRMALKWHPDRCHNRGYEPYVTEVFQKVHESFQYLTGGKERG